jgi:hypothetical protein
MKGVTQVSLLDVNATGSFAKTQRAQFLLICLVKHVSKERVDGVVLRELLLENEHIVHVREDTMEIRREKMWLYFFAHLRIT